MVITTALPQYSPPSGEASLRPCIFGRRRWWERPWEPRRLQRQDQASFLQPAGDTPWLWQTSSPGPSPAGPRHWGWGWEWCPAMFSPDSGQWGNTPTLNCLLLWTSQQQLPSTFSKIKNFRSKENFLIFRSDPLNWRSIPVSVLKFKYKNENET